MVDCCVCSVITVRTTHCVRPLFRDGDYRSSFLFFRDGAKRSSISLHFPHNLIVVLRRRSSLDSFRIEMRGSLVSGRRSSLVLSELQLPSSSSKPIAFIARIRPRFRIRRRSSSSSPSSLQPSSSYFELRRCRKVEEKQCALAMVSWET